MAYIFTDVSNISFHMGGSPYDATFKIFVQFEAKKFEEAKRVHTRATYLKMGNPFACCGMRTMSHMIVFNQAAEFHTPEFIKLLAEFLDNGIGYNGGNVSFVLNSDQRRVLTDNGTLAAMDSVGRGVRKLQSFRNFNMNNTNYLYNWTYKGAKPRQKKENIDALGN